MKLLDNSSLSLFLLEIPEYEFLKELYEINESLNITHHVKKEFEVADNLNILSSILENQMIKLEHIDYSPKLKARFPNLGEGELSIIQWGLYLNGSRSYYCVLDDFRARKVAKKLNLSISGSIGLIILLKNKNNYSKEKIEDIIDSIRKSNFRVNGIILNELRG